MVESGLRFVRRHHAEGDHYFIVNRGTGRCNKIIQLAVPFESAVLLDPWQPTSAVVVQRGLGMNPPAPDGALPVDLEPGESMLVRTFSKRKVEGKPWVPAAAGGLQVQPLVGPWKLAFIEGGPVLPQAVELKALGSWTQLTDPAASNFSGTAKYSIEFEAPTAANVSLDLGIVCATARVMLNDRLVGISWCAPRVLDLTQQLKPGRNQLVIEVTNLAANRIADLDRRKVPWKRFHEINFVNIDYKNFDASTWPPLESGLIGPVQLLMASLTLRR
jgi:hypothetical protein